jgi:hypothetical protein
MIAELRKNYHGVLCNRCREPIPVSVKIARLQDKPDLADAQAEHAFTLRCRACVEEGVYAVSEIWEFEGEPRARISQARAAGT